MALITDWHDKRTNTRLQRKMRRLATRLYRLSVKYNIMYSTIYFVDSEGTACLNCRANLGNDTEVVNDYKFVAARSHE